MRWHGLQPSRLEKAAPKRSALGAAVKLLLGSSAWIGGQMHIPPPPRWQYIDGGSPQDGTGAGRCLTAHSPLRSKSRPSVCWRDAYAQSPPAFPHGTNSLKQRRSNTFGCFPFPCAQRRNTACLHALLTPACRRAPSGRRVFALWFLQPTPAPLRWAFRKSRSAALLGRSYPLPLRRSGSLVRSDRAARISPRFKLILLGSALNEGLKRILQRDSPLRQSVCRVLLCRSPDTCGTLALP